MNRLSHVFRRLSGSRGATEAAGALYLPSPTGAASVVQVDGGGRRVVEDEGKRGGRNRAHPFVGRVLGGIGRLGRSSKRAIGSLPAGRVGLLGATVQFLAIALGGGIASTWYAVEWGAAPTALSYGPWRTWANAGRPDIDPYTRAHLARRQRLAFDATIATTFEAQTDDTGEELHSACEYLITAPAIDANWWRLVVFTRDGRLHENRAGRHLVDRHSAIAEPDGTLRITLAREARPGNWLPTGGGALTIVLTISEDRMTRSTEPQALPGIQRLSCR